MRASILVALIAAFPPTLAAILSFRASRSIRRTVGEPAALPLADVVQRLDQKLDNLVEGQAEIRERLVRLEAGHHHHAIRGRS